MAAVSCSDDDDNDYYLCTYPANALVTVKPVGTDSCYLQLDNNTTLNPVNIVGGLFGGKGIIDIKAFYSSLKGRLPDGAVLSHDLLEGLLSGAGNVGDIALYDGFPSTPRGYLSRLNRWTRGDWQLLAFLFGRLPLNALGRYLILDNLRRSLVPAATLPSSVPLSSYSVAPVRLWLTE